MKKTHEILGWYGVLAILSAYILLNFSFVSASDLPYLLLNLTGGIGIIADACYQKNYQPVILNIVWASIALLQILKIFLQP